MVPARNASGYSLSSTNPERHPRWDHSLVIVNRDGRRFGNEDAGYSGFAPAVMAQGSTAFAVYDRRIHKIAAAFRKRAAQLQKLADDQDRLWLAETGVQPNRLVAFDPKTRQFVANIPIASNGAQRNTIRHMTFDRTNRKIWFGKRAQEIVRRLPIEAG